jgi:hypothetical protein
MATESKDGNGPDRTVLANVAKFVIPGTFALLLEYLAVCPTLV